MNKFFFSHFIFFSLCIFSFTQAQENSNEFIQWVESFFSKPNQPYEDFYFQLKASTMLAKDESIEKNTPVAILFSNKFSAINEPLAKWLIAISPSMNDPSYVPIRDAVSQFNDDSVAIWYKLFKENSDKNRNWKNYTIDNTDYEAMKQATAYVFSKKSLENIFPENKAMIIKMALKISKGLNTNVDPFFYKTDKGDLLVATKIVVDQTQAFICSYSQNLLINNFDSFKTALEAKKLDQKMFEQIIALYKSTMDKFGPSSACSYTAYTLEANKETIKRMLSVNQNYYQFNPFPIEGLTAFALSNSSGFSNNISSSLNIINNQMIQFRNIGWSSPTVGEYVTPLSPSEEETSLRPNLPP
jgi:hypothetical protein